MTFIYLPNKVTRVDMDARRAVSAQPVKAQLIPEGGYNTKFTTVHSVKCCELQSTPAAAQHLRLKSELCIRISKGVKMLDPLLNIFLAAEMCRNAGTRCLFA